MAIPSGYNARDVLFTLLQGEPDGLRTAPSGATLEDLVWSLLVAVRGANLVEGDSLPDQAGHDGEFLSTNGTIPSWQAAPAGSGGADLNHWCEDVFGPDEEIVTGTRYITHLPRPQSIPRFWLYVPTPGGDVSVELRHNGSLVWSGVVSGEKEVAAGAYQAAFQSGNFAVGRLDLVVTAVDTAGAYSTEPMGLRICV